MKLETGFLTQRLITPLQLFLGLVIAGSVLLTTVYFSDRIQTNLDLEKATAYQMGYQDCLAKFIAKGVTIDFSELDSQPAPLMTESPQPTPVTATAAVTPIGGSYTIYLPGRHYWHHRRK